jgi:hypothetical protein
LKRNESGQSLVLALVAIALAAILLTVAFSFLTSSSRLQASHAIVVRQQASTDSGVEYGIGRLGSDPALRTQITDGRAGGVLTTTIPFTVTAPNGMAPTVTVTLLDPANYDAE